MTHDYSFISSLFMSLLKFWVLCDDIWVHLTEWFFSTFRFCNWYLTFFLVLLSHFLSFSNSLSLSIDGPCPLSLSFTLFFLNHFLLSIALSFSKSLLMSHNSSWHCSVSYMVSLSNPPPSLEVSHFSHSSELTSAYLPICHSPWRKYVTRVWNAEVLNRFFVTRNQTLLCKPMGIALERVRKFLK